MPSILIVDDNAQFANCLRSSLQVEGYAVEVSTHGEAALAALETQAPDLIMLDLAAADNTGFEMIRAVRDAGSNALILVLSERVQEIDKVQSFNLGADDFVVKPVGLLELMARAGALLRRYRGRGAGDAVAMRGPVSRRMGDIDIDLGRRMIQRGTEVIEVRPMEFALLLHLVDAGGQVVSRQSLMQTLWRYSADITTRTIDQHVNRLRRRLHDDPSFPRYIATVRKAGYRALV